MFRLVLVSAALVVFAAGTAPKVRPIVPMLDARIAGGKDADITELPHQVSVEKWDNHICGGSIIASDRILTAAHCTDGASASRLSIRAGSTYRGEGGQVVSVRRISQHPNYNSTTADYDVSVLELSSSISLGKSAQVINLDAAGAELAVGTLAIVSGWGTTSSGGYFPVHLKKVKVPKVSDSYCQSRYGRITARMTCHGYKQGGKDSCQGDSGGPLIVGKTQVGVASWGRGCASAGYPGVYAKVSNSEILNHINNSL